MDVFYLIMLHNESNIDKKFQLSIFYGSQVKHVFPQNGHTDNSKYRVASLLKNKDDNIHKSEALKR